MQLVAIYDLQSLFSAFITIESETNFSSILFISFPQIVSKIEFNIMQRSAELSSSIMMKQLNEN